MDRIAKPNIPEYINEQQREKARKYLQDKEEEDRTNPFLLLCSGKLSSRLSYEILGRRTGSMDMYIKIIGHQIIWHKVESIEEGQSIAARYHREGHKNLLGSVMLEPQS